jgi:hypothetical protein
LPGLPVAWLLQSRLVGALKSRFDPRKPLTLGFVGAAFTMLQLS